VTQRGMLKHDMSEAVVLPSAPWLLASAPELRRSYNMSSNGSGYRYVHKTTGAVHCFRLDRARFGDDYFHALFADNEESSVSSLDFYNPATLQPVAARDEVCVWALIRAVERLHWATNHMSVDDMTRLRAYPCSLSIAVALRSLMTAHSQLESSRGLLQVVGDTAQGDVFLLSAMVPKSPFLSLPVMQAFYIVARLHRHRRSSQRTTCHDQRV
jgi:hypothetical protein